MNLILYVNVSEMLTYELLYSTQFEFIAAYLEKSWKTRQEFLFGE